MPGILLMGLALNDARNLLCLRDFMAPKVAEAPSSTSPWHHSKGMARGGPFRNGFCCSWLHFLVRSPLLVKPAWVKARQNGLRTKAKYLELASIKVFSRSIENLIPSDYLFVAPHTRSVGALS